MSRFSKILLGLLVVAASYSGYTLYNKHFVKDVPAPVVAAPAPVAPAPVPAPVVVAPVEAPKPEMPLEQVLPKIFAEEKPKAEAPKAAPAPEVKKAEAPKPKSNKAKASDDTTVAKRVAGETKKVVGAVIDGVAEAVDATIDGVKKTGQAIANAKCAGDDAWKKDKDCQWVRDTWGGSIGPWNQSHYDYYPRR